MIVSVMFYVGAGGAQAPPNVGQAPQIFWFQQQKYAFLKSRLFLYSSKINTHISQCISNDEITDQISALSKSCYSLIRNCLARTVFNTPKTVTSLLSQLLFTGLKLRNVLNTNFFLLHKKFQLQSGHISPQSCISPVPSRHPFAFLHNVMCHA